MDPRYALCEDTVEILQYDQSDKNMAKDLQELSMVTNRYSFTHWLHLSEPGVGLIAQYKHSTSDEPFTF